MTRGRFSASKFNAGRLISSAFTVIAIVRRLAQHTANSLSLGNFFLKNMMAKFMGFRCVRKRKGARHLSRYTFRPQARLEITPASRRVFELKRPEGRAR